MARAAATVLRSSGWRPRSSRARCPRAGPDPARPTGERSCTGDVGDPLKGPEGPSRRTPSRRLTPGAPDGPSPPDCDVPEACAAAGAPPVLLVPSAREPRGPGEDPPLAHGVPQHGAHPLVDAVNVGCRHAETLELAHVAVAQLTACGGDDDPVVPVRRRAVLAGPDELAGHAEVEGQARFVAAVAGLGLPDGSDQPLAVPARGAETVTDQGRVESPRRELAQHAGFRHLDIADAAAGRVLENPSEPLDVGKLGHGVSRVRRPWPPPVGARHMTSWTAPRPSSRPHARRAPAWSARPARRPSSPACHADRPKPKSIAPCHTPVVPCALSPRLRRPKSATTETTNEPGGGPAVESGAERRPTTCHALRRAARSCLPCSAPLRLSFCALRKNSASSLSPWRSAAWVQASRRRGVVGHAPGE